VLVKDHYSFVKKWYYMLMIRKTIMMLVHLHSKNTSVTSFP